MVSSEPVFRGPAFFCTRDTYLRNMKQLLAFGTGSIAEVMKDFLLKEAASYHWQVTIIGEEVIDEVARKELIRNADVVISFDPGQHQRIAENCIECGTHFI